MTVLSTRTVASWVETFLKRRPTCDGISQVGLTGDGIPEVGPTGDDIPQLGPTRYGISLASESGARSRFLSGAHRR